MASPRKERAAATRARIIEAAYELFTTVGYSSTTVKAVAERAGVAVQTVYFVFHTKPELLSATTEDIAAGAPEPQPVADRTWFQEALDTNDGRRSLALSVEHGVDIYRRIAPLAHAIREAALADSDVDIMWSRIQMNRKEAMRHQVEHLQDLGQLRPELDIARGGDILHAMVSHETYLDLVQRSGWPLEQYKAWLYRSICQMLLIDEVTSAPDEIEALRGLSFR